MPITAFQQRMDFTLNLDDWLFKLGNLPDIRSILLAQLISLIEALFKSFGIMFQEVIDSIVDIHKSDANLPDLQYTKVPSWHKASIHKKALSRVTAAQFLNSHLPFK